MGRRKERVDEEVRQHSYLLKKEGAAYMNGTQCLYVETRQSAEILPNIQRTRRFKESGARV